MEQVPKDSLILPKTHQQAILTMLDAFRRLLAVLGPHARAVTQLGQDPSSFGLALSPKPTIEDIRALGAKYGMTPHQVPEQVADSAKAKGGQNLDRLVADASRLTREIPNLDAQMQFVHSMIANLEKLAPGSSGVM